jgi:hypothetical protein
MAQSLGGFAQKHTEEEIQAALKAQQEKAVREGIKRGEHLDALHNFIVMYDNSPSYEPARHVYDKALAALCRLVLDRETKGE